MLVAAPPKKGINLEARYCPPGSVPKQSGARLSYQRPRSGAFFVLSCLGSCTRTTSSPPQSSAAWVVVSDAARHFKAAVCARACAIHRCPKKKPRKAHLKRGSPNKIRTEPLRKVVLLRASLPNVNGRVQTTFAKRRHTSHAAFYRVGVGIGMQI